MFKNCKKRTKTFVAMILGVAAAGVLSTATLVSAASQDVKIDYNFNTYDSTISFEKAGWATMAGSGFSFQDGKNAIWGNNIDQDNNAAIPYKNMKYRVYLNKQITPNNNAVSIGYNEQYDTATDPEAGTTNTPYIVYDNPNSGKEVKFEKGENVVIQTRVKTDLNEIRMCVNLWKDQATGKNTFLNLLEFKSDGGLYIRTEANNWGANWICRWEKNKDYLITILMQDGSNDVKILIDGALLYQGTLFADGTTLDGINKIYFYADYTKETAPYDPTKLLYIDDFKIAKGDYIVGDVRYDSPAIQYVNTPCVPGKLTASFDMTILDEGVNMPLTLLVAEYNADNKLIGVAIKEKTFTSEEVLNTDFVGGGAREGNGTLKNKMKFTCDLYMAGNGSNIVKIFAWNTTGLMTPVKKAEVLQNTTNIYIASDSLAANYIEADYPQAGWGMFLPELMADNVNVHNEAVGGASTKTYYDTFWSGKIKEVLQPGDYVLIAFAHNDRWGINTNTCVNIEDYKMYLNNFISETREKGAEPILITAFNRGEDKDTSIVVDGDVTYDYVAAMKEVAAEKNVVCLDLHKKILDYMAADKAANGSIENVKEEIYLYHLVEQGVLTEDELQNHRNNNLKLYGEDLTHTSETGAAKVAGWIAEMLEASDSELKEYLK